MHLVTNSGRPLEFGARRSLSPNFATNLPGRAEIVTRCIVSTARASRAGPADLRPKLARRIFSSDQ